MGGTSTISGGKLCLRIDPRVPTLSGLRSFPRPNNQSEYGALIGYR